MKKLLLLLLVFPLVFVACSDDDDEKATDALVGTWSYAGSYGIVETNQKEVTDEILDIVNSEADEDNTITFTKDGKITADGETIPYSVKGNSIILTQKNGSATVEIAIPYTLKGKNLELFVDYTEDWQEEYEGYEGLIIKKVVSVEKYTKE